MPMTLDEILASHRTGRPVVMGILNVTPDSFSDGGRFLSAGQAIEQARRLAEEGADAIDVGAESTRPGSARVPASEQIARLREVLPAVARTGAVLSIDTTLCEVADFALDAGAAIVNDISAGRDDPRLLPLVARRGAGLVLMHMLGEPKTMQRDPVYRDVAAEVREFLSQRLAAAERAGVARHRCIVDPGIGFGKKLEHNLALLAATRDLAGLGCPVLIAASRKRFLGELTGVAEPAGRLAGTLAACLETWRRGATIFRVHDVAPLVQALAVARAIRGAGRACGASGGE
jgi:dihydropteroate synthase